MLTIRIKEVQDEEGSYYVEELKRLHKEVGLLLEQENIKWNQRSKRNWYTLRDENTKFFHTCATQRRKMNQIHLVVDSHSRLRMDKKDIAKAFKVHYFGVYKTTTL